MQVFLILILYSDPSDREFLLSFNLIRFRISLLLALFASNNICAVLRCIYHSYISMLSMYLLYSLTTCEKSMKFYIFFLSYRTICPMIIDMNRKVQLSFLIKINISVSQYFAIYSLLVLLPFLSHFFIRSQFEIQNSTSPDYA